MHFSVSLELKEATQVIFCAKFFNYIGVMPRSWNIIENSLCILTLAYISTIFLPMNSCENFINICFLSIYNSCLI